jgi:hypothetical protein
MEAWMNERVKAVVDSFKRLTNGEQTAAYLEIEAIWKALRDTERTERPRPAATAKQMGDDWPR